jgi:hypothetical protein
MRFAPEGKKHGCLVGASLDDARLAAPAGRRQAAPLQLVCRSCFLGVERPTSSVEGLPQTGGRRFPHRRQGIHERAEAPVWKPTPTNCMIPAQKILRRQPMGENLPWQTTAPAQVQGHKPPSVDTGDHALPVRSQPELDFLARRRVAPDLGVRGTLQDSVVGEERAKADLGPAGQPAEDGKNDESRTEPKLRRPHGERAADYFSNPCSDTKGCIRFRPVW